MLSSKGRGGTCLESQGSPATCQERQGVTICWVLQVVGGWRGGSIPGVVADGQHPEVVPMQVERVCLGRIPGRRRCSPPVPYSPNELPHALPSAGQWSVSRVAALAQATLPANRTVSVILIL